jgi:hypothetical protein
LDRGITFPDLCGTSIGKNNCSLESTKVRAVYGDAFNLQIDLVARLPILTAT